MEWHSAELYHRIFLYPGEESQGIYRGKQDQIQVENLMALLDKQAHDSLNE